MKYLRSSVIILFIIIFVFSIWFNIFFVSSKNIPQEELFTLTGIYFDLELLDDNEAADKIYDFLESKNSRTYVSLIKKKNNPVAQFYAFSGLMRMSQKRASRYLKQLLASEKKVNVFFSENEISENNDLGFAILSLLNRSPKNLINPPTEVFFENIKNVLSNAYNSNLVDENQEYKEELLSLITNNVPELSKTIFGDLVEIESISNMSQIEKIELSYVISTLSSTIRKNAIEMFLKEENEQILINTLKAVEEEDSKSYANLILRIFYKRKSEDVTKLAVERYGLLLKENSITQIQNFMRVIKSKEIIKSGLKIIKEYGNLEDYEFLKMYLGNIYSAEINILALEAIIKTTYEENPEDVLNTIAFILRNGKEEAAYFAIKFHIDNNIKTNYGIVLYRLRQKENKKMKQIAIEYIDYFNLKAGYSLLKELSKDTDYEIKRKAGKLLPKFSDPSVDINS